MGVDIGDGLVLRYDETSREMVGLTVIGLRDRLLRGLGDSAQDRDSSPTHEEPNLGDESESGAPGSGR